jgi:hypothetical protein
MANFPGITKKEPIVQQIHTGCGGEIVLGVSVDRSEFSPICNRCLKFWFLNPPVLCRAPEDWENFQDWESFHGAQMVTLEETI